MTPASAGRFCLILSALIVPALAQQAQLRVLAIEGEGTLNNTAGRANRDVVVEVQGADLRPITGAQVTFNLPLTGASGTFANGERTLTLPSNAAGRATASGIRPNNITGPLQIRVAATYFDQTATLVINQTNVAVAIPEEPKPEPSVTSPTSTGASPQPAPKRGMSKAAKVLLVLAIAGGAAAGITLSMNKDSSNGGGGGPTTPPPIVITPGTPSVGGPQ